MIQNNFSRWFKVALIALAVVYVSVWFFTIYLCSVQREKGFEPVLPVVSEDSQEFSALSESIMAGKGFTRSGEIETLRAPGYPMFVAAIRSIGRSYFVVTFIQIILIFVAALIVRKIGSFYSSKNVGEIAAFLLLANPVSLTLTLVILTDVLFLFLFAAGFYLALSIKEEKVFKKILIISAIFSAAIYVRPMGLFALPIFAAPVLASQIRRKVKWQLIVVMVLFLIASTIPWVIRNYKQTGVAGFTSFKALNLSFTTTLFLSDLNNTDVADEDKIFEEKTGVPEPLWRDLKYSKKINSVAQGIIFSKPFSYAKFHMVTSVPFLFPSTIAFSTEIYRSIMHQKAPFMMGSIHELVSGNWKAFFTAATRVWWKFAERLVWLAILIISCFGVWKERRRLLTWAFVCIILYLMFLSGSAAGPRYSFQAWPYLFILFATGAVYVFNQIKIKFQ